MKRRVVFITHHGYKGEGYTRPDHMDLEAAQAPEWQEGVEVRDVTWHGDHPHDADTEGRTYMVFPTEVTESWDEPTDDQPELIGGAS